MAKSSNTTELFEALTLLAREKGISAELLIEKIQTALVIAIKKDYPRSENTKFDIDIAKGKFDVSILKDVVEVVGIGEDLIDLGFCILGEDDAGEGDIRDGDVGQRAEVVVKTASDFVQNMV